MDTLSNHADETGPGPLDPDDDQLIAEHLSWLRRRTSSTETLKHRRDNLRRVARRLPVLLIRAQADDLDRWQSRLQVSQKSIHTYTSHVRAFYKWLYESDRVDQNPALKLPMPKIDKGLPRPIPEKHLTLAFRLASGDLRIWLALAGWLGLRAGEIARLSYDSVIEEHGFMYLRIDGKGGKERVVPVPDEVAVLVRSAQLRAHSGPLFRMPSGLPAQANYVSRTSAEFFRSLDLPYVLHQLRHRFGTQHYRLTRDIRQTQALMGHSSPNTTALYVALNPGRIRDSMRQLGKTLPSTDPQAKPARRPKGGSATHSERT